MSKFKLISFIFIILLITGVVGFYMFHVSKDLKAEDSIRNEFNQIMILNKDKDTNKPKIDEILNRNVASGSYKIVEEASKNYLKDLYTYIDNINYLVSSEHVNYLSIENIKNNRVDDFATSLKDIDDTKKQITDNINKLVSLLTDEQIIMSYINEDLDQYYVNFYKSLVSGSSIDEEYINNKYGYIIERLEIYNEALNYLVENKNYWKIPETLGGTSIMFDNADIENGYRNITEKLKTATKNITEIEE